MEENAAEALMIRYLPELIKAISEPSSLACSLFAHRIISRSVYNEAIAYKSGISKQDKSVSICDAVLQSIHVTPCHLVEFVEAARQDSPAVDALCEEITKDPVYGEYHCYSRCFGSAGIGQTLIMIMTDTRIAPNGVVLSLEITLCFCCNNQFNLSKILM